MLVSAARRIDERAYQVRVDANGEPCIVALRLLSRGGRECSDEASWRCGRSPGASGRIAGAVKRVLDHVSQLAARSGVWSPPAGTALVAMMMVGAGSADAGSRWS